MGGVPGDGRGLDRGDEAKSGGLLPGRPESWAGAMRHTFGGPFPWVARGLDLGNVANLWRFVPGMPEAWAGAMRVISRGLFPGPPASWAMAKRPISGWRVGGGAHSG